MGCDIHAFVEYPEKYTTGYRSLTEDEFWLPRDYAMFGVMAGARIPTEDVVGGFEARGLPDDIDHYTKEAYSTDGYHHASWLSCEEFNRAILNRDVTVMRFARDSGSAGPVSIIGREYRAVAAAMRELGEESRIVFWFDN